MDQLRVASCMFVMCMEICVSESHSLLPPLNLLYMSNKQFIFDQSNEPDVSSKPYSSQLGWSI